VVNAKCDTRSAIVASFRPPRDANAMDFHNQPKRQRQYPDAQIQFNCMSRCSITPTSTVHILKLTAEVHTSTSTAWLSVPCLHVVTFSFSCGPPPPSALYCKLKKQQLDGQLHLLPQDSSRNQQEALPHSTKWTDRQPPIRKASACAHDRTSTLAPLMAPMVDTWPPVTMPHTSPASRVRHPCQRHLTWALNFVWHSLSTH
jgi:hypothetical protein